MSELTQSNVVIVEFDSATMPNKIATDKLNEACHKAETFGRNGVLVIKWCRAKQPDTAVVDSHSDELAVYQISRWEKALRRVEKLDVLTIAQIEADVTGVGMALALLADYRVSLPQLGFSLKDGSAILPGMAVHRLAHHIGLAYARKLVLFGQMLSAETLSQLGFIDDISAQPDATTAQFVGAMADEVLSDIAVRRRLLLECLHQSYDEALGTHLAATDRVLRAQS